MADLLKRLTDLRYDQGVHGYRIEISEAERDMLVEYLKRNNGKSLVGMLVAFSNTGHENFDLLAYSRGEWSWRNLEALISDLMEREKALDKP